MTQLQTTARHAFDPAVFKETTRQQWDNAAPAWNDWGRFLTQWLGGATDVMLDMARISEGHRVLDVAGPMRHETGLVMADIDLKQVSAAKRSLDIVGHYARPDIFSLQVCTKPQRPVEFQN